MFQILKYFGEIWPGSVTMLPRDLWVLTKANCLVCPWRLPNWRLSCIASRSLRFGRHAEREGLSGRDELCRHKYSVGGLSEMYTEWRNQSAYTRWKSEHCWLLELYGTTIVAYGTDHSVGQTRHLLLIWQIRQFSFTWWFSWKRLVNEIVK